jgi:hypothetical protein
MYVCIPEIGGGFGIQTVAKAEVLYLYTMLAGCEASRYVLMLAYGGE